MHSPNFVVLLSGPWAVGKTFLSEVIFWPNILRAKKINTFFNISLYGLCTLQEIDDALLQVIFPRLVGHRGESRSGAWPRALSK